MKRHNAKAIAAAAAAANMARKTTDLLPVPPQVIPKCPILYVDVVKNMAKEKPLKAVPPPPVAPLEFSIFREDFPALPGGNRPPSVASVPDDWTSMISDDDDEVAVPIPESLDISSSPTASTEDDLVADQPNSEYSLSEAEESSLSSYTDEPSTQSGSTENDSTSTSSFDVNGQNVEYIPEAACCRQEHTAAELLCEVSVIFSKQFIQEGVRQRSMSGSSRKPVPVPSPPNVKRSNTHRPASDGASIGASFMTHFTGMPVCRVPFGCEHTSQNPKPPGPVDEGEFGLLGLAHRLGVAQDTRDLMQMAFAENNLVSTQMAASSRNLLPSFAGPFQGLRWGPLDYNNNLSVDQGMANQGMPQPKMHQMEAELLFYFFYTCPGDMMQMLAAAELADRNWRFHMKECLWIRRQADNPNYVYNGFQESGEYNYFNQFQWKILPRFFNLDPDLMEQTLSKEELCAKYGYHPQM
ncbi:uncharacterized protein LOC117185871 [Drosophila miranda]|uniref:uncharacterized protein LOC117185871 n=1 Tax=Drosophila miranda TaxID=7229 RepID=UPI00143F6083|nr:uncharacterized protein LOC117185871 [Drosophila miranda]